MSILEHQECLSLYWNKDGKVFGIRVGMNNSSLTIIDSECLEIEEDTTFAVAAKQLIDKLITPTTHLIVVGGFINSCISFDLSIPSMAESDIKEAIQYELARYIPCDLMEMAYGYRIIRESAQKKETTITEDELNRPQTQEDLEHTQVMQVTPTNETNKNEPIKMRLRVFAILKKDWNEFIAECTMGGLKFDAFLYPFQVIDPILGEYDEIFLPDVDHEFKFVKLDENLTREMLPMNSKWESETIPEAATILKNMAYDNMPALFNPGDLEGYTPALINGAYALSKSFALDRSHLLSLPKELIPERFRFLKTLFFILLGVAFCLIFVLFARFWWNSWSHLQSLHVEKKKIERKTEKLKRNCLNMKEIDDLITEVKETSVGHANMAYFLYKLTSTIPKDMWMQNINIQDKSAILTVKAPAGKQSTLLPLLNRMKTFKVTSSKTKRFSDGTENILVTLAFKDKIKPKTEETDK